MISDDYYLLGLLSVAIGQIIVILYDFKIKSKKNNFDLKKYNNKIIKHISNYEGLLLLSLYLTVSWKFKLLPLSYYIFGNYIEYSKLVQCLLLQDLLQTVMHYFEHKIKFIKIYHDLHHIHIIPTIYDSFDGSIQDTILMIIIPLHITAHSIQINTITYISFGTIYSMFLFLIHADYDHIWDKYLPLVGIMNAKCHRIHHQKRIYNYGHFFSFWDRAYGTYYNG
jgi:alternative squalene epoxidase